MNTHKCIELKIYLNMQKQSRRIDVSNNLAVDSLLRKTTCLQLCNPLPTSNTSTPGKVAVAAFGSDKLC